MKLNRSLLLLLSFVLPLSSCGGTSSMEESSFPSESLDNSLDSGLDSIVSSDSSFDSSFSNSSIDSEEDNLLTFDEAVDLLLGCRAYEGSISSEIRTETYTRGSYVKQDKEVLSVFLDGSSLGKGELSTSISSKVTAYDHRVEFQTERFRGSDGSVVSLERRIEATEYSDSSHDSEASKQYVLPSNASSDGFADGSYIYESEKPYSATLGLSKEYAILVAGMGASPYLSQKGILGFEIEEGETSTTYSMEGSYSLTEDYLETTYTYSSSFVLSSKGLEEFTYSLSQTDTEMEDKNNTTTGITSISGSLVYETRDPVPSGVMKASDFFLESVEEVSLLDSSRNVIENPNAIYYGSTMYLFGYPLRYTPSKVLGLNEYILTPFSSNNEEVVELEVTSSGSYFLVKGSGSAELTFAYIGLDNEGIYDVCYVSTNITVIPSPIASVRFSSLFTPEVTENTLLMGRTYRQNLIISPSYGVGTLLATSSDPEVLSVTLSSGTLAFTPHKEGSVVIRVECQESPEVYCEETLTVQEPIEGGEIPALLASYSWYYKDIYDWEVTFHFDELGNVTYSYVNTMGPVEGKASYSISLFGNIILSSFEANNEADASVDDILFIRFGENGGVLTEVEGVYKLAFESETMYKTYTLTGTKK